MSQRTAGSGETCHAETMILKAFSYLMIGAFVSGLVITLVGSARIVAGL